ncbi:hypothetical protein GEMRC1_011415 [Eukaryota sp. GEM-RC1]
MHYLVTDVIRHYIQSAVAITVDDERNHLLSLLDNSSVSIEDLIHLSKLLAPSYPLVLSKCVTSSEPCFDPPKQHHEPFFTSDDRINHKQYQLLVRDVDPTFSKEEQPRDSSVAPALFLLNLVATPLALFVVGFFLAGFLNPCWKRRALCGLVLFVIGLLVDVLLVSVRLSQGDKEKQS